MSELARALADAKAEVARLEQLAKTATCRELGCDMKSVGGCNAGCDDDCCACSVPVNECSRCGASDYGDNEDAVEVRKTCRELQS